MKVIVGNTEYNVYWRHGWFEPKHPKATEEVRGTECVIYQGTRKEGELIASRVARLNYQDNFCRYKGRKESLRKALQGLKTDGVLNKEHIKLFWDEFRKPELEAAA